MRQQVVKLFNSNLSCLALVATFNAILALAFVYLTTTPPPHPPPLVLSTVIIVFLAPIGGYFFVLQRSVLLERLPKILRLLVAAILSVVFTIVLLSVVGGMAAFLYILEH